MKIAITELLTNQGWATVAKPKTLQQFLTSCLQLLGSLAVVSAGVALGTGT